MVNMIELSEEMKKELAFSFSFLSQVQILLITLLKTAPVFTDHGFVILNLLLMQLQNQVQQVIRSQADTPQVRPALSVQLRLPSEGDGCQLSAR